MANEKDTKNQKITLLSGEDLRPKFWQISYDDDKNRLPLSIKNPILPDPGPLLFDSFKEASDFLEWLKNNFKNLSNNKLGKDGHFFILPDKKTATQVLIDKLIVVPRMN